MSTSTLLPRAAAEPPNRAPARGGADGQLDPIEMAKRAGSVNGCLRRLAAGCFVSVLMLNGTGLLPGEPDSAFGEGGKVTTDFAGGRDEARAVILQPDGKMVVAGPASGVGDTTGFALARYDANGVLDRSFGVAGKIITDFGGQSDEAAAMALALQPDGKIVAAGFALVDGGSDVALARYETNGALDPTFGRRGRVTNDFAGQRDQAFAVAIQPDGKIVVAGCTRCLANDSDSIVARYQPDGTLDPTFGTGGRMTMDFAGQVDSIASVALQQDGAIVTAGFAAPSEDAAPGHDGLSLARDGSGVGDNSRPTHFAVARFRADGTLDATFGDRGKVMTDFNGWQDQAASVVIQGDGKIVVAGRATTDDNGDFALARYLPDGRLDPTFGDRGKVTTDFGGGKGYFFGDAANGVALQRDGKIVVVGLDRGKANFGVARYLPNGALDPAFGNQGKVSTDFHDGRGDDGAWSVAIDDSGRIIVVGSTDAQLRGNRDIAIARYHGDRLLKTTPCLGQPGGLGIVLQERRFLVLVRRGLAYASRAVPAPPTTRRAPGVGGVVGRVADRRLPPDVGRSAHCTDGLALQQRP